MKKLRDGFILYASYYLVLKDVPLIILGIIFLNILKYAFERVEPVIENAEARAYFKMIQHQMDFDTEKYEEKCKRNKENIMKRYNRA